MSPEKKSRTSRIPMKVFREGEVSLAAITVRPDLLQPRFQMNTTIMLAYSDLKHGGSPFPPVGIVEVPDGSLWLYDGFHRHGAALKLKCKTIPAVIRRGTLDDALLLAIEMNYADSHAGVHPDRAGKDRQRAAELMIRSKKFNGWNDTEIGRRCGIAGSGTIRLIRLRLQDQEGIRLPARVELFTNGVPTGRFANYLRPKDIGDRAIKIDHRGKCTARVHKEQVYLGTDPVAARVALVRIESEIEESNRSLVSPDRFRSWLASQFVHSTGVHSGLVVGKAYAVPVSSSDYSSVKMGIATAVLGGKRGVAGRLVLVGYFGGVDTHTREILNAATLGHYPIETMTPEEFVAEVGPKDETADQPSSAPKPTKPNKPSPLAARANP